jgi:hypothetical protein
VGDEVVAIDGVQVQIICMYVYVCICIYVCMYRTSLPLGTKWWRLMACRYRLHVCMYVCMYVYVGIYERVLIQIECRYVYAIITYYLCFCVMCVWVAKGHVVVVATKNYIYIYIYIYIYMHIMWW